MAHLAYVPRTPRGGRRHIRALAELRQAGASDIIVDQVPLTGRKEPTAALRGLVDRLGPGGRLLVYRLADLGLGASAFAEFVTDLATRGIRLESLVDKVRFAGTLDDPQLHTLRAIASLALIRGTGANPRTGRPSVVTGIVLDQLRRKVKDEGLKVCEAAQQLGISPSSAYRALRKKAETSGAA